MKMRKEQDFAPKIIRVVGTKRELSLWTIAFAIIWGIGIVFSSKIGIIILLLNLFFAKGTRTFARELNQSEDAAFLIGYVFGFFGLLICGVAYLITKYRMKKK